MKLILVAICIHVLTTIYFLIIQSLKYDNCYDPLKGKRYISKVVSLQTKQTKKLKGKRDVSKMRNEKRNA